MKRISLFFILSVFYLNHVYAEIKFPKEFQIKRDTTIAPSKDQISSSLIALRDSIDNSILTIQKKRDEGKSNYAPQFDNAYTQLTSQRREIEKVIEEVVVSNEQTWDENIRLRAINQIALRRRDYYQTLETLKGALDSKQKSNK